MASSRIFPFAPGIPWTLKHGKYILPDVQERLLFSSLKDKEAIVACPGGLFESFCSFAILESLNFNMPSLPLFWSGDDRFLPLLKMNGLAKPFEFLSKETLDQFPVPLFFDAKNKAVFNCLNNYLNVFTYYGSKGYRDCRAVIKQITEKSLTDWEEQYIPKLRNLEVPSELVTWMKMSKFYLNKPFVIIIPGDTGYSQHKNVCLDWNPIQVKSLASMLHRNGISVVVFSDTPMEYMSTNVFTLSTKLEYIMYFMSMAHTILSKEIDYLLISNLVSSARIVSLKQKNEFSVDKNNKFLGKRNVIYTSKSWNPYTVYETIISG